MCVQKTLWQSVPIHIHECNLPPEKTCKVKFQVLHTCVELIVHHAEYRKMEIYTCSSGAGACTLYALLIVCLIISTRIDEFLLQ